VVPCACCTNNGCYNACTDCWQGILLQHVHSKSASGSCSCWSGACTRAAWLWRFRVRRQCIQYVLPWVQERFIMSACMAVYGTVHAYAQAKWQ
jgi:hypothetical protein